MTIFRKQRHVSRFKHVVNKYGRNPKKREQIQLIVFLGYLTFLKELSRKSRLLAHEERSRTVTVRHVRKSAKVVLERMKNAGQQ